MSTTSLYNTTPQTGTVSSENLTSLYSNATNFTTGIVNSSVYSVNGGTGVTVDPTTGNVVVSIGQDVSPSSNVQFVNVKATGNLSNNYFTLVNSAGTSGQVLTTNGSGATAWTNVSSLGLVNSVSGSGAGISVSPTTGNVVVSNTGVTSNIAGTGISVSGATGAVTIANTGVTSIVAGTNISVSSATGAVTVNATDTNTTYTIDASSTTGGANFNLAGSDATIDTIKFASGTGITVAQTDANTITITNNDPGSTGVTSITGTTNQIIVSSPTGAITLSTPQDIATTSNVNFGSVTTSGDIAVNGGDITTTSTTASLYNTTATTLNIGGASTATNIGNLSSTSAYVSVPVLRLYNNISQIDGGTVITTSTATFPVVSTTRQSMKIILNIVDNVTTEVHSIEAFAMKKGTNAYLTTYAELYSASALATFSADVSGGSLRLLVTPLSANNTTSRVIKQSLT